MAARYSRSAATFCLHLQMFFPEVAAIKSTECHNTQRTTVWVLLPLKHPIVYSTYTYVHIAHVHIVVQASLYSIFYVSERNKLGTTIWG